MRRMLNIGLLCFMPRHGGGTYQLAEGVICVLKDYAEARGGVKIHLFFSAGQAEALDEIRMKYPNFHVHRIGKLSRICSSVQRRIFLAVPPMVSLLRFFFPLNWIAQKHHIDLMVFPGMTADTSFYRGRQITIFTDIAHVFYSQFPELVANGELRRRNILFKYCVRYADQLVVESEQLRSDTVKYYGADPAKIEILHQTVSLTLLALQNLTEDAETAAFRHSLPKRYLFYPAQLWAHKNHKNLLYAFKSLMVKHPDLHLILVGSRKPGDQSIFDLMGELDISRNVKWMGYVPDKFIPILYRQACALVKPGYIGPTNLPTLEAFFFGCPAVITDLPGVQEQTADAAILFDPNSPKDIAEKIDLVLADEKLRHGLIAKGYERLKVLGYESYRNVFSAILDKNLGLQKS